MYEPRCWDDLYEYFDAKDIFEYGAVNLYNVICHLYAENTNIYHDLDAAKRVMIGDWVNSWLASAENTEKLLAWDESQGDIIDILDGCAHMPDPLDLGDAAAAHDRYILGKALLWRQFKLRSNTETGTVEPPRTLRGCWDQGLENWLSKSHALWSG